MPDIKEIAQWTAVDFQAYIAGLEASLEERLAAVMAADDNKAIYVDVWRIQHLLTCIGEDPDPDADIQRQILRMFENSRTWVMGDAEDN